MVTIEENVPLSQVTTFRTGGPARFLLTVPYRDGVAEAVAFAEEQKLPLIPLGTGSNMLAPDPGVPAVFVRYDVSAISAFNKDGDYAEAFAGAGTPWDEFVAFAVSHECWGVENLSAIPGTVGAAVVQNIGAYGVALGETVIEVEAFDTEEKIFKKFSNAECRFGYRTSRFKEERDRYLITLVTFRLSTKSVPRLSYKDVAEHFASGEAPTLPNIRHAIQAIRSRKFPPLSEFGTAGSFFLNPVLSERDAEYTRSAFPGMPLFAMPEGGVKVPLAWILDHVLSLKGMREGGAFLWEAQPLVIAAERDATSADVIALAEKVIQLVKEKTNIAIVPEVRIL